MEETNLLKQVSIHLKPYTAWMKYFQYFCFLLISVGRCTDTNTAVTL